MTARHFTSEALLRSAVAPVVHGLWRARVDRENFDRAQGPCFLYGNHSNNLDAFVFNVFRPFGGVSSGVLTAEYMRGGIVTWALKGVGLLATRKRVPEPHLIPRIMRLLDAGRMVFIYPEGGRRWDGRPAPWIEATAKLFARVGVPVYPIVTHGSYVGWPRWATYPRPAHLRVEVCPPVPASRSLPLEENLKMLAEGARGNAQHVVAEPTFTEPAGSKHDYDQVVIALNASGMSLSINGKPAKTTWKRGDVALIGRGEAHESKNTGGKPAEFIIVSVK